MTQQHFSFNLSAAHVAAHLPPPARKRAAKRPPAIETEDECSARTVREEMAAPPAARRLVVLVGCGAAKAPKASKAKDLYTGSLFRAARKHAERLGAEWRILSARYGLVKPERVIKPYNQRMYCNALERVQWATAATTGLTWEMGGKDIEVIVLAGEAYADPICAVLESRGIICHRPLAGLTMGKRLQWFKAQAQGVA